MWINTPISQVCIICALLGVPSESQKGKSMNDPTRIQVTPESLTPDIVSQILGQEKEIATAAIAAAQKAVADYAALKPGQRPAYFGMFLVVVSIAIELLVAIFSIKFSSDMLMVMLVSGMVILVAGSILETYAVLSEVKTLNNMDRDIVIRKHSLLGGYFGMSEVGK
jgi:hypothetical protein